ncbi:TetR/AcrR family transcriptional regulator [Paenibacillus taichungensis]|uniref:TetR/AcrR family transcriptional regulator n=1 Tax=Paenibacillus taichungensis TaxID=484184 RepID=A0ABX2MT28_9BACL|nr:MULTISPECIES: TetR/AcrR family transcriptional regulator [Paenibacillus]NUU56912.1 TetR/AcrR family transcriptional regulator [Paenibacillus taichungensis]PIH55398.1 TetR family transcriptional regulator [Paenibacillus sp. LK1]
MLKMDRRSLKSQEAIKKAIIELMSEKSFDDITIQDIADKANVNRRTIYLHYIDKFDLLDKLIENHINELKIICEVEAETDTVEGNVTWFRYFERNYSFFSAMLASKGAPFFRNRFLEFVTEDIKNGWDMFENKDRGITEDILVQFISPAYVGIVEWWFINGMPYPPDVMGKQVGILLENNLS